MENNKNKPGINRREFLKRASLGAAAVATFPLKDSAVMKGTAQAIKSYSSSEFGELTIYDFQKKIKEGQLNSRKLVEFYLQRIKKLDKEGPTLNSILEINPDVLKIADKLDQEYKAQGPRSALHGVPVIIKANIDTADKMTTTAGSLALKGSIPPQDSLVAKKLREAGAVILGKANLSEWANFRSSRSSSGWSSLGGQTKNPYALDRNPSGSSSGSAVAVAADFCLAALGTETDGSVVSPSSTCGIVGLKPTVGIISRSGIIPISHSQDTAGPMAKTVTDVALLLEVLTGPDPRDPATKSSVGRYPHDYTKYLDKNGLKGKRIGIARHFFGFHEKVDHLLEGAIKIMKDQGAVIIDPVDLKTGREYSKAEYEVLLYEFKADLNAYLASLGPQAPVHSLKEIIEFNKAHRQQVMPYFEQEIFLKAEKKGPLTEKKYVEALNKCRRLSRAEGIDAALQKYKLEAVVAPTNGPA
ncbi:MAG: amidase, partial [Candidatus Aminicenantales bacterium]